MVRRLAHQGFALLAFLAVYYLVTQYFQAFAIYFWPALFLCLFGAEFPDVDMIGGLKYHRSVITHGPFLMTPLFIYYALISVPRQIHILLGFTFLGYASHLLLDNIPARFAPLQWLWKAVKLDETPGEVNHIPSQFEELWLLASAGLLIIYAYLFFTL